MNKIQIWFLTIAGLLGLGIPFMFLGLQLPSAMNSAILAEAAEYVILDEEDENFWAVVPGRTEFQDLKAFFLFECENPEEVAIRGIDPLYKEIGPFHYVYEHVLSEREYVTNDKVKDREVSYIKKFNHRYTGNPDDLKKEYRVINLSGMKQWSNVKHKARFLMAIEGFFETFLYATTHFIRDLSMKTLAVYYKNLENTYRLVNNLKNISTEVIIALNKDPNYGLFNDYSVYDWTLMCENLNYKIEHEVYTYFGFSLYNFLEIRRRFCEHYTNVTKDVTKKLCSKINGIDCSHYNISYYQWMYGNMTDNGESYSNVTYKKLPGIYEFSKFRVKFMEMLDERYKDQFKNVQWNDKLYIYILDTHHEYPDFKTDEASALLYDNMKNLYDAGTHTENPFTMSSTRTDGPLDLYRFEKVARTMKINKEQAFMLFSYFEYYMNNTVIQQDIGGNIETERIGNYGAIVLKDISDYGEDYLDLVIYTRSIWSNVKGKSCQEIVNYYFTVTETKENMKNISEAICNKHEFNTDLSAPVGFKYFVVSSSYPFGLTYIKLLQYLQRTVYNFTDKMLDAMIYNQTNLFWKDLDVIRRDVKTHYQGKSGNKACENKFSPYCTKRQFLFSQLEGSYITKYPYPKADLPTTDHMSEWRKIIEEYIEWGPVLTSHGSQAIYQIPDKVIEVPIEFDYFKKSYGNSGLTRNNLYNCLNFIKLYDTDVVNSLFLRMKSRDPLNICKEFGTEFFYNYTRYLIRNVQFGPMFNWMTPDKVFFGYYDKWLNTVHDILDYLEGDDCTVDPWIGYNPIKWEDKTQVHPFHYLTWRNSMYTGIKNNNEIRKYSIYHHEDYIFYRTLERDKSGDKCSYITDNPYTDRAPVNNATDGLQYAQTPGYTTKGDTKVIIEPNTLRPLTILRINDDLHDYYSLEVDTYLVQLDNKYVCPSGISFRYGADMTSFYHYRTVITAARYYQFSEPGLNIPTVTYSSLFDKESPPSGFQKFQSYYMIEPYTGITMRHYKKYQTSLVLYYDNLYKPGKRGNLGELIPFFSLYENGTASKTFADHMSKSILSSKSTREAISITFTVLGLLFVFTGISMIIRACFFDVEEITGVPLPESTGDKSSDKPNTTSPLLHEGEDLQHELSYMKPNEAKIGIPDDKVEDLHEERPTGNQTLPEPEIPEPEISAPEVNDENEENLLP